MISVAPEACPAGDTFVRGPVVLKVTTPPIGDASQDETAPVQIRVAPNTKLQYRLCVDRETVDADLPQGSYE